MLTYRIHFIRTGSTGESKMARYVGQLDLPLCDKGIHALDKMRDAYRYPRVERVYTSPLLRCVQTAERLYPDNEVRVIDELKDMNLGEFEGKTLKELRGNRAFAKWIQDSVENPPPDGEALDAFMTRIVLAVGGIFDQMMEEGLHEVAVITHNGVIMSLLAGIGLPKAPVQQWATENGMGFTLLFTPQMWMRDRSAEIFAAIPEPYDRPEEEDACSCGCCSHLHHDHHMDKEE